MLMTLRSLVTLSRMMNSQVFGDSEQDDDSQVFGDSEQDDEAASDPPSSDAEPKSKKAKTEEP